MLKIDSEYENAIRFFLNKILTTPEKPREKRTYSTNPAKQFSSYIREYSKKDNYLFSTPLFVTWNLTSACNFRCVHCLYNGTEYAAKNDLSLDRAIQLAEELINDFGINYIILTGGEIFLRPDLMDIIRLFKKNNIAVRLLTNASIIKQEQIEELSDIFNPYLDSVHISLDGATKETFQKIRQTDSFETITNNIKNMTSKNIRVLTVCTANTINYREVPDAYKLSCDLGAYEFFAGKTIYYNDSHKPLMLSDRELFLLYEKLYKKESPLTYLSTGFYTPVEFLNIPEVKQIIEEEYYQKLIKEQAKEIKPRNCHYHDKCAIQSDGTVYLCLEALSNNIAPIGNCKTTPISKVWENRISNPLFIPRKIENMQCNGCFYSTICNSGCPVKSYINTGSFYTPQIPCSFTIRD